MCVLNSVSSIQPIKVSHGSGLVYLLISDFERQKYPDNEKKFCNNISRKEYLDNLSEFSR